MAEHLFSAAGVAWTEAIAERATIAREETSILMGRADGVASSEDGRA